MPNGKQLGDSFPKVAKGLERVHRGECSEDVTVVALRVFDCGDAVAYGYRIELDGNGSSGGSVLEAVESRKAEYGFLFSDSSR
jgi:hypothetical protein